MKIAFLSDVHGNEPALRRVLKEIDRQGCGRIISLGDVFGYYCRVNECVALMREAGVVHLLGNHDQYILQGTGCPRSTSANLCLDHQRKGITEESLGYIREASPSLFLAEHGLSLVHGGWLDPVDEYIQAPRADYFQGLKGQGFLSGHTHIQRHLPLPGGRFYCNPGSVGQPRDQDPRAAWCIFENGKITLCRSAYDIDEMAFYMKTEGLPAFLYENLYTGTRIQYGGKT